MVQWMLDRDVDVSHQDNQQRNCLFYAMMGKADNSDVVRALLEKGNSPPSLSRGQGRSGGPGRNDPNNAGEREGPATVT